MMQQQEEKKTFQCPRGVPDPHGVFKIPTGSDAVWRPNDTCSYCGCWHPDKFFEAIEAGAELGPTDKDYKVYVRTDEGPRKFYFPHLDAIGRRRFLRRLNDGALNIGPPGHFYTLPYFITHAKEET